MPLPSAGAEKLISSGLRGKFPESAAVHSQDVHDKIAAAIMEGVGPFADTRYFELLAMITTLQAQVAALAAK